MFNNKSKGNKIDSFTWYRNGIAAGAVTDRKTRREYERKLKKIAKRNKNKEKLPMFLITHNYSFVNTGNINVIYVCHSQNDEDDKKLYDIVAEFDNKKRILLDKNLSYNELKEKLDYLCIILKAEQLY